MPAVQLGNRDARLAFLAIQYHLARPGSELDPETKQPGARGLAPVANALEPQLDLAVATLELSDGQRQRLLSAISAAINALKSSALLAAGGRSSPPAFESALRRLFPDAAGDPDEATQLAGHMLELRRRLESAPSEPSEPPPASSRKPWWRFWSKAQNPPRTTS